MKTSAFVKSLAAALVLAGSSALLGGCAQSGLGSDPLSPPAYTGAENAQRSLRNIDYERSQVIEDFDQQVTMSRPASKLTKRNVLSFD